MGKSSLPPRKESLALWDEWSDRGGDQDADSAGGSQGCGPGRRLGQGSRDRGKAEAPTPTMEDEIRSADTVAGIAKLAPPKLPEAMS